MDSVEKLDLDRDEVPAPTRPLRFAPGVLEAYRRPGLLGWLGSAAQRRRALAGLGRWLRWALWWAVAWACVGAWTVWAAWEGLQ